MGTITVGLAVVAVVRYANEQRWKRQQAIFDFLDDWLKTPGARNAAMMLETRSREVPLWDFGAPEKRWTVVTWEDVAAAYSRTPEGDLPDDPGYTAIRDSFADLFHRLSRVERMIEQNLIREYDAAFVVQHYVRLLRDLRDEPHVRNIRAEFFARPSSRMPSLFRRFGLDIKKGAGPIHLPRREERFAPE